MQEQCSRSSNQALFFFFREARGPPTAFSLTMHWLSAPDNTYFTQNIGRVYPLDTHKSICSCIMRQNGPSRYLSAMQGAEERNNQPVPAAPHIFVRLVMSLAVCHACLQVAVKTLKPEVLSSSTDLKDFLMEVCGLLGWARMGWDGICAAVHCWAGLCCAVLGCAIMR